MPWRGEEEPGEFPTLGPLVIDWIQANCVIPDGIRVGDPFILSEWQIRFAMWYYRLEKDAVPDPEKPSRAFVYDRGGQLVAPQKALALDTPIPTPQGWSTIAGIRVGDFVFDQDGQPTEVLTKSEVFTEPAFRVVFSDGASLVAGADHEWVIEYRNASCDYVPMRVQTEDLLAQVEEMPRVYRVKNAGALAMPDAPLPLDPYVLGAWLGDGCINDGRIVGADLALFDEIRARGFEVRVRPDRNHYRASVLKLKAALRSAGVLSEKHIPPEYLRASIAQRWALLAGLMDTDGTINVKGDCSFTTVHPLLRDGFRELLYSLGIKNRMRERMGRLFGVDTRPNWEISFSARAGDPVFTLPRKLARLKPVGPHAQHGYRRIVAVEPSLVTKTQCIGVASPSRTFLAGHEMIPTGNCGKGPFSAAIICAEAAAPVLFDGWDAAGEPVGRPWPTPWIQVTAVSESQTDNVWRSLVPMIDLGTLTADVPDTGETRINLPNGGRIEPVTASARSRLGQRVTFVVQDEAHDWTKRNRGRALADNQRRNIAGMGGRFLETGNAWDPSDDSVAQQTYEGKTGGVFKMMFDGGPGSIRNKRDRMRILKRLYGTSWWVDTERISSEIDDLLERGELAQAERFFLNRVVAAEDRAFDGGAWRKLADPHDVEAGTLIVIGIDGARYEDALAIVATDVDTGYQWPLGIWEKPQNAPEGYEHPMHEVEGAIQEAFERYAVWRVYVDPGSQTGNITPLFERWQGKYGDKVVLPWLMTRWRATAYMIRNYASAIASGDLSHDGDERMAAHIDNARRRPVNVYDEDRRQMWVISKDAPNSPMKIDAAAAGALSWEARGDAIAAGAEKPKPRTAWTFEGVVSV